MNDKGAYAQADQCMCCSNTRKPVCDVFCFHKETHSTALLTDSIDISEQLEVLYTGDKTCKENRLASYILDTQLINLHVRVCVRACVHMCVMSQMYGARL